MSQQPQQAGPPPAAPYMYPYPYPYGYYPYSYPYPWYQPPTPVERAPSPGGARLFTVVVIVLVAALTVGALGLASAAPSLVAHAPSPASLGFQQVYNQRLADDVGHWDLTSTCGIGSEGLHAEDGICNFLPSTSGDLTGQGFLVTVGVAPGLDVASEEDACITLSTSSVTDALVITQQGAYTLVKQLSNTCNAPNPLSLGVNVSGDIIPPGNTVAWHSDAYEPNQISIQYSSADQAITVYVNDQRMLQAPVAVSGELTISLGAPAGAEALYTTMALYSATPGG
jgi:hypothetical protein